MVEKNFKYKDELEHVLHEHNIKKENICLVGSMVLSLKGIREHGDIDFCLSSEKRKKLQDKVQKNYLSDNVNLVVEKYNKLLGITDYDLVNDSRYHEYIDGFKVIRLEVEFSAKLQRKWKKDKMDLPLLEQYIRETSDWDWDLVIIEDAKPAKKRTSRKRKLLAYFVKGLQNPVLGVAKLFNMIKKKISNSEKKALPSTSLENQLIIKMPTAAVLGNQFFNGLFMRYDILLRYLTVSSILSGSEKYVQEYKQMQAKRVDRDTEVNIRKLALNVGRKGFLSRYPISISSDGMLVDGAHRLACALFYEVDEVPVQIKHMDKRVSYGREWFKEQGFKESLLNKLDQTKGQLFIKHGIWFSVLLWPPVSEWFDEIEAWLRANYKVCSKDELYLGENFADFTREIYAIDDIDLWKVERKIHAMKKYSPHLRAFAVELTEPKFRVKKRTSSYLSDTGAKLKASVRNEYKNKVPSYIYDIVCHTGDNHEHNSELFRIIKDYKKQNHFKVF